MHLAVRDAFFGPQVLETQNSHCRHLPWAAMVMQRWETQSHGAWGKSVVLFVRIRTTGRRSLHMTRDRLPHRPRGLQTKLPHIGPAIWRVPVWRQGDAGESAPDCYDIP